ncbi:hypothetical protein CO165_04110 [Candidatus Roizmanbacteria bacterium CG_4_9_14_3_um_filter_33_18]|uniref:Uncharacterized protein n=3 Tax=Candidatus Roizmaniibacteriota TaxID=1752723 RepID=A0A2M7U8K6_9BACT|nr:MAG: hypothetical protein COW97_00715 [Candidatus Roizmanbacteria bacterium CG22_combo_CG10-13_8_21_14_all_34_12]PIZ67570.1 MAG: hypothetical protein COY12_01615 [Candidatus Roizmanbacteria bacterium CG_4_10_14_0_2_um_filter_33_96]PJA55343.1 MAG: hypothetical protein CO165_04110 [Candidatus Roizmanbacteria bacterium CG_4_9_14_3_um_filter_33_18]
MKKLEEKIIKKIYRMEAEKTIGQIISEVSLAILLFLSSSFIFSVIVEILNEQASFDLFDFLRDDFEIIRENFFNNSLIFVQELPQPLIYILIGLLLTIVWLLYVFTKNFNKIKNKLVLIYKFWFK